MLIPIRDYLHDAAHEQRIADAKAALLLARTFEERLKRAAEMRSLINSRSVAQIRRMEHARGLV